MGAAESVVGQYGVATFGQGPCAIAGPIQIAAWGREAGACGLFDMHQGLRLAPLCTRQCACKDPRDRAVMAKAWQRHGKDMAKTWQRHGKGLAKTVAWAL